MTSSAEIWDPLIEVNQKLANDCQKAAKRYGHKRDALFFGVLSSTALLDFNSSVNTLPIRDQILISTSGIVIAVIGALSCEGSRLRLESLVAEHSNLAIEQQGYNSKD